MIKGIFSRAANKFNKIFKNRSLINILVVFAVCFILIGCFALLKINYNVKLIIIVFLLLVIGACNAIFQILAKKYFNNFTNSKILPSICSAKIVSDNIFRTIITLIGSAILMTCNIKFAMLIFGAILILLVFGLFNYAKNKLGLALEEYTQKDIYIRK